MHAIAVGNKSFSSNLFLTLKKLLILLDDQYQQKIINLIFRGHMPTVSLFFGITIKMYYNDHLPPHFHAEFQGQRASFDFSGKLIAGNFNSKVANRLIKEWSARHKLELMINWSRLQEMKPINWIKPLE